MCVLYAISWKGAMLFALITALIHWLLEEKSEEPSMADIIYLL